MSTSYDRGRNKNIQDTEDYTAGVRNHRGNVRERI